MRFLLKNNALIMRFVHFCNHNCQWFIVAFSFSAPCVYIHLTLSAAFPTVPHPPCHHTHKTHDLFPHFPVSLRIVAGWRLFAHKVASEISREYENCCPENMYHASAFQRVSHGCVRGCIYTYRYSIDPTNCYMQIIVRKQSGEIRGCETIHNLCKIIANFENK